MPFPHAQQAALSPQVHRQRIRKSKGLLLSAFLVPQLRLASQHHRVALHSHGRLAARRRHPAMQVRQQQTTQGRGAMRRRHVPRSTVKTHSSRSLPSVSGQATHPRRPHPPRISPHAQHLPLRPRRSLRHCLEKAFNQSQRRCGFRTPQHALLRLRPAGTPDPVPRQHPCMHPCQLRRLYLRLHRRLPLRVAV